MTTHSPGRRAGIVGTAIALAMFLAPALTACGTNPVESVIEGVTGGNVDIGETSIPDDFPAEVPLVDGEIINVISIGQNESRAWTVMIRVPDASSVEGIKTQLEGAGFTAQLDQSVGEGAGVAYTNSNYAVLVAVVSYEASSWAAMYTVTPIPA